MSRAILDAKELGRTACAHGERLVGRMYGEHRAAFINWAMRRYGRTRPDAEDVFQDAVFALYRNMAGNPALELADPKAYLFKIGAHTLIKKAARERREAECLALLPEAQNDGHAAADNLWLVREKLGELGETLRRPLELYYLHGYCHEAVAREMNYKTPEVAKTVKRRALKLLQQKCLGARGVAQRPHFG